LTERVTMAHGAGGTAMRELIQKLIVGELGGSGAEVPLEALDDSSVVEGIALHSDSSTVKPLFFPGGDIGRLAVSGTVNDLAVIGARPLALTCGLVLEEGFPLEDLRRILRSASETCREAGVHILAGDTKVMEKGALDQMVINTSGIGVRSEALERNLREVRKHREMRSRWLLDSNLRPGDRILVSGTVGDHGVAILSAREGYGFETEVRSDVAPLNGMIREVLEVGGIVAMKDPTRGGLSNALNEWSEKSGVGILLYEERIPVREGVRAACEMLGMDPLEMANEGKVVVGVVPQKAEEVLEALRSTRLGREAELIGEVTDEFRGVVMETSPGGRRILPPPYGDPVPRIC
jgi:hydrogenase expression/formation protein HypE